MVEKPRRGRKTEKRPLNLVDTEAVSAEYKKDRLQEIKKFEAVKVDSIHKLFFQAEFSGKDNHHLIWSRVQGNMSMFVGCMKGSVK